MEQLNSHKEAETEMKIEDVPYQTDKEMLMCVGVKFLVLFIIIFTYDFLIDLVLMVLDFIFEIFHLLIEIIDELLESLLKDVVPTSHRQNEIILVNIALIIAVLIIYKLVHGLRSMYRLKRHLKADWLSYKKRKSLSWQLLPNISKIKLVVAYCTGFSLLFLFAF